MDVEATSPTAHTLACLRRAGLVAATAARLACATREPIAPSIC